MPNEIVTRAIDAICKGDHLTADHAAAVLAEIMEGRAEAVQTGAFLIALRAKGETVPELVGLARTMRSLAAEYEDGIEVLVFDSSPTSGTLDIVRGYADRVRLRATHASGDRPGNTRVKNRGDVSAFAQDGD